MSTLGLGSDQVAVCATIDPDANAIGTVYSDAIDSAAFDTTCWALMCGTLGSSATIDFKLQSSATSGGSYADISGKAATQITQAGTDQSDTQAVINCRAAESDNRFIRAALITGGATSDTAVIGLGLQPRHGPASDADLASVGELVS